MPAGGWRQSKFGWAVQRSPPPVSVPAKSVAGRAPLFQVKVWLPPLRPFFGGLPMSEPLAPKYQERALRLRDREAVEVALEAGVRRPGRAACAVVEHDPDGRLCLEGVQGRLVGGLVLDRVMGQGHAGHSHRRLVDQRREGGRARRVLRSSLGDVELEEVEPAVERLGIERVDVEAVGEGEPLPPGPGEAVGEVRAVGARLLVVELAGHENRHADLVARMSPGRAGSRLWAGSSGCWRSW